MKREDRRGGDMQYRLEENGYQAINNKILIAYRRPQRTPSSPHQWHLNPSALQPVMTLGAGDAPPTYKKHLHAAGHIRFCFRWRGWKRYRRAYIESDNAPIATAIEMICCDEMECRFLMWSLTAIEAREQ